MSDSGIQHWESGLANIETGQLVTSETVFQACSLSKPLFSYLVFQLIQNKQLPENFMDAPFEFRGKNITARQALSHQTGLPNEGSGPYSSQFDPGEGFRYSGEGYLAVQQQIILCLRDAIDSDDTLLPEEKLKRMTGVSLQTLADRFVFDVIGMKNSSFVPDEEKIQSTNYSEIGIPRPSLPPSENAAGSLRTTAEDYARFVSACLSDKAYMEFAFTPAVEDMSKDIDASSVSVETRSKIKWGLGWVLQETDDGRIIAFHWGHGPGARAFVAVNIDTKESVMYFANSDNGMAIVNDIVSPVLNLKQGIDFLCQKYGYVDYREPAFSVNLQICDLRKDARTFEEKKDWLSALSCYERIADIERAENPVILRQMEWLDDLIRVHDTPVVVTLEEMHTFQGDFGPQSYSVRRGVLCLDLFGREYELIPVSENTFAPKECPAEFRIIFSPDRKSVEYVGSFAEEPIVEKKSPITTGLIYERLEINSERIMNENLKKISEVPESKNLGRRGRQDIISLIESDATSNEEKLMLAENLLLEAREKGSPLLNFSREGSVIFVFEMKNHKYDVTIESEDLYDKMLGEDNKPRKFKRINDTDIYYIEINNISSDSCASYEFKLTERLDEEEILAGKKETVDYQNDSFNSTSYSKKYLSLGEEKSGYEQEFIINHKTVSLLRMPNSTPLSLNESKHENTVKIKIDEYHGNKFFDNRKIYTWKSDDFDPESGKVIFMLDGKHFCETLTPYENDLPRNTAIVFVDTPEFADRPPPPNRVKEFYFQTEAFGNMLINEIIPEFTPHGVIAGNIILAGHSLAAYPVLEVASKHPEKVGGLILVSPALNQKRDPLNPINEELRPVPSDRVKSLPVYVQIGKLEDMPPPDLAIKNQDMKNESRIDSVKEFHRKLIDDGFSFVDNLFIHPYGHSGIHALIALENGLKYINSPKPSVKESYSIRTKGSRI